jgi:hypothetical protein
LKIKETVKRTECREKIIYIDDDQIIQWLKDSGKFEGYDLHSVEVFVNIPGGGDWSNMELEVDKDCPVIVKVKKVIES